MDTQEKIDKYRKLILKRKSYRFADTQLTNPSQTAFDVDEIEPWAQWQNNLNAHILLVGQEFSDLNTYVRTEGKVEFDREKYAYPSNKHLNDFFKIIGFDIGHPSEPNLDNPIFFTNAVMGLKNHPMSANFKTSWLTESRDLFLKPLIDIIDPKIIITLGIMATKSVAGIYNFKISNLRDMVGNSPIIVTGGKKIFPVYHTGGLGLRNRKKELQIADWTRIMTWL